MNDEVLRKIAHEVLHDDLPTFSSEPPTQAVLADLAIKLVPFAEGNYQKARSEEPSFFMADRTIMKTSVNLAMMLWEEAGRTLKENKQSKTETEQFLGIAKKLLKPLVIGKHKLPKVELPKSEHVRMPLDQFFKTCCGLSKPEDRQKWYRAHWLREEVSGQGADLTRSEIEEARTEETHLDRWRKWMDEVRRDEISNPIQAILEYRYWRIQRGSSPDKPAPKGQDLESVQTGSL